MRRSILMGVGLVALAGGCAAVSSANNGAHPNGLLVSNVVGDVALPVESLYAVCWPADAQRTQQVVLTFNAKGVFFEPSPGVSNATARCLREVADSYRFERRPQGAVTVQPPETPPNGWQVLGYVELLAPSRFQEARGLLRPTELVQRCIAKAARGSFRSDLVYRIETAPAVSVRAVGGALSDSERCVEAVLGSTAWPSAGDFLVAFPSFQKTVGDELQSILPYFAPAGEAPPAFAPESVREALSLKKADVARCWETALLRRAGLSGGRTVRFRVKAGKTEAWMTKSIADAESSGADLLFDRCLVDVVKSVPFAQDGEGAYSWVFAERG
jgi:hypothetical protein